MLSEMTAEVNRPTRYFSLHYTLLRFLGLGWWHHPDEHDARNFPGWYLYYAIVTQLVWVVGFVGLETIDPFVGEKDLDRFMFSLSFVITHDLTLIKLFIFYFRNTEIQDIVQTLEIELYQYYQNNEKNRATIRITKILTGAFLFFGWLTIGNASIYGALQDVHWKAVNSVNDSSLKPARSLPQPIFIPWNYQDDKSFIPTFALETVGLLWTGHIVMTIDTFIGSVILHMSSQFAVLREAIVTAYDRAMAELRDRIHANAHVLPRNANTISPEDDNERIARKVFTEAEIENTLEIKLVKCFRQHQVLIGCVEKFSRTYSYGFMTQLLSSMAAICVVMVQVSQDASSFKSIRLVTSLAFFFAMITQLAIQCFTANELTLQAERIASAVMQSKWERMPRRLSKLLLVTMIRAQRPLRLTAAGFANMDNACFLAVKFIIFAHELSYLPTKRIQIMKAAYSYYAVLSQK